MGFWMLLLVWSLTYVVGALIRPKPELENVRPRGLGDFNFPTATQGRPLPILWGTALVKGPNLIWFGNLRTTEIKNEVGGGLFSSSDWVVVGHNYYVSILIALCKGPLDNVRGLKLGDWWTYPKTTQTSSGALSYAQYQADGTRLWGNGYISMGANDEAYNSDIGTLTGHAIAYRGTAYYLASVYVGESPNILTHSIEATRIPTQLGTSGLQPTGDNYDANPMSVLYEIMTDQDWGIGIASSKIDTTNFRDVGGVLLDEGNMFSMFLDASSEASKIIDEIMRQIDGALYFNRETGLWKVKLARFDYTLASLPTLDEDSISKLDNYSRPTWKETTNEVRVKYTSRDYQETYAIAQDGANMLIQGEIVSVEVGFPGVMAASNANNLAARELKVLAYPLAKSDLVINRIGYNFVPGDVFKLSWGILGVVEEVHRIVKISYGSLEDGKITLHTIQDIFSVGTGIYGDPIDPGEVDPYLPPVAPSVANSLAFEGPRQMIVADDGRFPRIWAGARDPGGSTVGFELYMRSSTSPPTGAYTFDRSFGTEFLRIGTLDADLDQFGTNFNWPNTSHHIDVYDGSGELTSEVIYTGNATDVSSLKLIVRIGDELIGYETVTDQGSNVYRLERIYRGLFNTVNAKHLDGDTVWFIGQLSGGGFSASTIPTGDDEVDIQLRSRYQGGVMTEGDSNEISLPTLTNAYLSPLPPRNPYTNGQIANIQNGTMTDYSTETSQTGEDGLAVETEVRLRTWLEDNVLFDWDLTRHPYTYTDDTPIIEYWMTIDVGGTDNTTLVRQLTAGTTGTETFYLLRNDMIIAQGANEAIASQTLVHVRQKHTPDTTQYTSDQTLEWPTLITDTALINDTDMIFGGLTVNVASDVVVIPETGNFTFDIKNALPSSGIVQIQVNSGGFTTLIGIGASVSAATALTISDNVELKFTVAPATYDRFFDVVGSTTAGYGVLKA